MPRKSARKASNWRSPPSPVIGLLRHHQVMEAYGAWGEKNMYGKVTVGVIRSTLIIDPDGRIAHHWKRVSAKGHARKVREKLEELQA